MAHEAKDHIDETSEEEKEKAEKVKAEKEKLEERIEKNREKREEDEELLEAQKSIAKLMDNNHMINEDIKGIEIDLNYYCLKIISIYSPEVRDNIL